MSEQAIVDNITDSDLAVNEAENTPDQTTIPNPYENVNISPLPLDVRTLTICQNSINIAKIVQNNTINIFFHPDRSITNNSFLIYPDMVNWTTSLYVEKLPIP